MPRRSTNGRFLKDKEKEEDGGEFVLLLILCGTLGYFYYKTKQDTESKQDKESTTTAPPTTNPLSLSSLKDDGIPAWVWFLIVFSILLLLAGLVYLAHEKGWWQLDNRRSFNMDNLAIRSHDVKALELPLADSRVADGSEYYGASAPPLEMLDQAPPRSRGAIKRFWRRVRRGVNLPRRPQFSKKGTKVTPFSSRDSEGQMAFASTNDDRVFEKTRKQE